MDTCTFHISTSVSNRAPEHLRIAIKSRPLSNSLTSSFKQSILLGVNAQAGRKPDTGFLASIAAWT